MKPLPRWLRIVRIVLLAILTVGVVLALTYRYWVVPAGTSLLLFRMRDNAMVQIVPTHIPTPTDPVLSGTTYTFGNVSFSVPWTGGKLDRGETSVRITFPNRQYIMVFRNPDVYTELIGARGTEMQQLLGPDIKSNYELYRAMVAITPGAISLFAPSKELILQNMLLTMKAVISIPLKDPLYEYDTANGMYVFAFTRATSTIATFFTPKDEEYSLWIVNASSAEYNSIIKSLRAN